MSLTDWLNNGIIVEEKTSPNEIKDLMETIKRELHDLEIIEKGGGGLDSIFRFAYNAARQCAKLALRACGYRVSGRNGSHYWVLQSLLHTLSIAPQTVERLEKFRKKRNIVEYEASGVITETETGEIVELAQLLFDDLKSWLKEHHPELIRNGN